MIAADLIELALELIAAAFDAVGGSPPELASRNSVAPFTRREKELSLAIQVRRNISADAADELVLWLRSQRPKFRL